ncbi:pyruvate kinase [candidate division KSB1 bacterium]
MTHTRHTRRAKIVCTLGPSSDTYEKIRELAEAGLDVARLNFSHGSHVYHKKTYEQIRKVSADIHKPIAVLQDLQGPKIRVQQFQNGEILLQPDDKFILTTREVTGTKDIVSVSYKSFCNDVTPGEPVLLDDGNIKLVVEEIKGEDVHCRVVYGGPLKDHKGLNLPGAVLSVPALTDKDMDDLRFGLELGVDYVALSFVQKPEDIRFIKEKIHAAGKNTPVVAKIEKPQAVADIESIIELTDAIMIARGDLGVEMDTEEVPPIQKKIIKLCNEKGVPVITATQMLESMIHSSRPTRAEAADVANAILDGSDAVMLSGETAAGAYPVESVETMSRIMALIEEDSNDRYALLRRKQNVEYPTSVAIGYSACHSAQMVNASAIICLTQSGSTANMIARFRPETPIIAVTPNESACFRLPLIWGVSVIKIDHEFPDNMNEALDAIFDMLRTRHYIKPGDRVVVTAGIPFAKMRSTNMLRIEEI